MSPGNFLIDLYHLDPPATLQAISDQAEALTRPRLTSRQVLDHVAREAPEFADLVRSRLP